MKQTTKATNRNSSKYKAVPLFETSAAGVLLNDAVKRRTFLADVVATACTADLRVEEECKLVEAAKTITLVKFSVLRQQFGAFYVILDLRLNSPVIYTQMIPVCNSEGYSEDLLFRTYAILIPTKSLNLTLNPNPNSGPSE